MQPSLKHIAWNGIAISVPAIWEVNRMGLRHLVLATDQHDVMELKWRRLKGRFSAESQFKRLAGPHADAVKGAVQAWQPPSSWLASLKGFHVKGFRWHQHNTCGHGVILYCPDCRTASLIQFFGPLQEGDPAGFGQPQILSTLSDHRDDGHTLWSIFDIRALLPENLEMRNYRFQPGYYRLAFENKGLALEVWRWAPADALLTDQTLAGFAANTLGTSHVDFRECRVERYPAVEWGSQTRPARWWHRLSPRRQTRQGRLWHLVSSNRVLGIQIQARKPLNRQFLDDLCASYGSV